MFRWETGFDAYFLIGKFRKMRTVNNEGRCGFKAPEYAFWRPVLYSAIRCSTVVGLHKRRCIDRALNDPALSLDDPDQFLERCSAAFVKFSQVETSPFVLFCDITYEGSDLATEVKDGPCTIIWNPRAKSPFVKRALAERAEIGSILDRNLIGTMSPET